MKGFFAAGLLTASASASLISYNMPQFQATPDPLDIPHEQIASGDEIWVPWVNKDRGDQALVNLGTIHTVDAALEFKTRWLRADGGCNEDISRIECLPNTQLSYWVDEKKFDRDGKLILHNPKNIAQQRADVVQFKDRFFGAGPFPYSDDYGAMVCFAASRKCEAKNLVWPQAEFATKLEATEQSRQSVLAFNKAFVPT